MRPLLTLRPLVLRALLSLNYGFPHFGEGLGVRVMRMGGSRTRVKILFNTQVDDVHTKWFIGESCETFLLPPPPGF